MTGIYIIVRWVVEFQRWWVLKNKDLKEIFVFFKGQIKPKADLRAVGSPKKWTNEFVLFAFLLFTANKTNSFIHFFSSSALELLSVLSDLQGHIFAKVFDTLYFQKLCSIFDSLSFIVFTKYYDFLQVCLLGPTIFEDPQPKWHQCTFRKLPGLFFFSYHYAMLACWTTKWDFLGHNFE